MKKVMLDAGHGGSDSGAVGNGLEEKDLTSRIAQYAKTYLLNYYEVQIGMTREDDRFIKLQERANIAKRFNADLFVSIHINAGGGTGFETFIYSQPSQATIAFQNILHSRILQAMRAYGQTADRGKK
ncbi:N-acetylmuramoyl-L-alanine amidase [Bacillus songklensis]|uniref:N-acetylmuramoyl-L-alanine amidase n=1 Tax=Bacillus songklensis TaxID=1069116 RepID=A0ABV8AXK1_9BACI